MLRLLFYCFLSNGRFHRLDKLPMSFMLENWCMYTEFFMNKILLILDLRNSTGILVWQSFDSPTDTLLPYQPLTRYTQLVSTRSKSNKSSGFYKAFFDGDNVLHFVFDSPETSGFYWPDPSIMPERAGRSRYNDTRIAVFDSFGSFVSSDGLEGKAADFGEGILRRLTLDFDGNLRLYSLDESKSNWVVSWQAVLNPCKIHGACGKNSICRYRSDSGRTCSCWPNFKVKNDEDWSLGCEPEFDLTCNRSEITFLEFPQTDSYGYSTEFLHNYTFESCKQRCLEVCSCKGFVYKLDNATQTFTCYPKRVLRNGFYVQNALASLFLKYPKNLMSFDEPIKELILNCSREMVIQELERSYSERKPNASLNVLIWVASVIGVVEIICIFLVWFFLYGSTKQGLGGSGQPYHVAASGFRRFTYNELKKATRGFNEEIGSGGSGIVYKGVLSDNRVAAIKQLNEAYQGEAEFLAEVSTIGRLNHMNLIEMWGYCAEGKRRLLVYEFMEHGSLTDNLYSNKLDWKKRFEICVGTAKGLAYLHEECLEWILHCDVKPQNILLDIDYQPKVADFGLSKLLNRGGEDKSRFSKIRGTRGYMAPEWIFNLGITSKVDVYSYGIVLLEMVTGKCPTTIYASGNGEGTEEKRLFQWVKEKVTIDNSMGNWIEELMDPVLGVNYDVDKMETLVRVGLMCVEENKDLRPTMSHVLEMLLHPQNDNLVEEVLY